MVIFKDWATVEGLRLLGNAGKNKCIEVGLHHTSQRGDFFAEISQREGNHWVFLEERIFKDFVDAVRDITNQYGRNNLKNFEKKANRVQMEMHKDKWVRKWKGI